MTACNLFGYGASDDATIMIMAGMCKALCVQIGAEISAQQIAKAMPSRQTLVNMEVRAAADCMIGVCYEILLDNPTQLALQADHGHRQGQDHFVKLLIWAGRDEEGNMIIKYHVLDVVSQSVLLFHYL